MRSLDELLALKNRDAAWRTEFFSVASRERLTLGEPLVFTGPDGFQYAALFSGGNGTIKLPTLAVRATNEGFGAALNPRADGVDWVFSYGDLLSLRMFGVIMPPRDDYITKEVVQRDEQVLVGAPSAEVLPDYARPNVARYLRAAGVAHPGVVLMHRPSASPSQQLFFNAPPEILNRLTWFFPRHYAIMATDLPLNYFPLDA
jgi:hypothetical protein